MPRWLVILAFALAFSAPTLSYAETVHPTGIDAGISNISHSFTPFQFHEGESDSAVHEHPLSDVSYPFAVVISLAGEYPDGNPVARSRTCGVCHGTGRCHVCGGSGWYSLLGHGGPCKACSGSGRCSYCGGTGIK